MPRSLRQDAKKLPRTKRLQAPRSRRPKGIPSTWTKVCLKGRDPALPQVWKAPSHELLPPDRVPPEKIGRIFVCYMDFEPTAMAKLQRFASTMKAPVNKQERRSKGMLELEPSQNDFVFARNKAGSGKESDDILKTWSIWRPDYTQQELEYLQQLREDVLGPDEEIGASKPIKVHGKFSGGTAFERHARAVNLSGGPRAYPLGVTNQIQKNLEGPSKGSKREGRPLDDNSRLRYRLLKGGAFCVAKGLAKGPAGLDHLVDAQSELVNTARLGDASNALCTAAQLNIAAMRSDEAREQQLNEDSSEGPGVLTRAGAKRKRDAEECEVEEDSDDEQEMEESEGYERDEGDNQEGSDCKRRKMNDGSILSLGKFGSNHADHGDSPAGPTACLNLTRPHPDVEQEWFYIFDLGVGWKLEELTTIYFSGLHYHSGCETRYRTDDPALRQDHRPYHRLTLIMYPSMGELDGTSATALGALPVDTRNRLLTIGVEMRNTSESRHLPPSSSCGSATYIADGLSLMEPRSYLNHTARDLLSLGVWLINQAPPEASLRIDKNKFLESISMKIDNRRVAASPWPLGPGWSGDDVMEGKEYEPLPADVTQDTLQSLRNSDTLTDAPYGNRERLLHMTRWREHVKQMSGSIPLCVATATRDPESGPSGSRAARKKTTSDSRRMCDASTDRNTADKNKVKEKGARQTRNDSEGDVHEQTTEDMEVGGSLTEIRQPSPLGVVPESLLSCSKSGITTRYAQALSIALLRTELDNVRELQVTEEADIVSNPGSSSAIDVGATASDDLLLLASLRQVLSQQHEIASQALYALQQDLLIINMIMWEQLSIMEQAAYSTPQSGNWFSRLVEDIVRWLDIQLPFAAQLDASRYLPALYIPGQKTHILCDGRTSRIYPNDPQAWACTMARQLTQDWLHYLPEKPWRYAAHLTRRMYDIAGAAILVLPATWAACRKPQADVFDKPMALALDSIDHAVGSTLKDLPIFQLGSEECTILTEIGRLCATFRSSHSADRHRLLLSLIPSISLPPSSTTTSRSVSPAGGNLSPALKSSFKPAVADRLLLKLETLYPFIDEGLAPSKSQMNRPLRAFVNRVERNVDKLLPFRDLARSRARVLEPGGPFGPDNLRTVEGFFSALMFRGMLFNTNYLADSSNPCVFGSVGHWENAIQQVRSKSETAVADPYFCDKSAYGSCAKDRSLNNAVKFWDAARNQSLNSWLLSGEKVSFESLFLHLQRPEFPAFGKLTSFLLAADYAIAGAIEMPSPYEVGRIVFRVGLGSLEGLKRMGFLCKDAESTGLSFAFIYEHFRARINQERQRQMGFNVFVMEHSLCKDGRLDGAVWDAVHRVLTA
ncbi:hypothetical protein V5O48_016103 [Marasmius crinis-equi]|uniref:Uncharacterized protein n=1 Tax=Marasmius crinis-equi TaxID=585013 RepID=A0ABR3ESM3_9AGAR